MTLLSRNDNKRRMGDHTCSASHMLPSFCNTSYGGIPIRRLPPPLVSQSETVPGTFLRNLIPLRSLTSPALFTPKEFVKYTRWLDKKGLAICDGTTENMDLGFQTLYPLFLFTGLTVFIFLLLHWERFRRFIFRTNKGEK